MQEAPSKKNRNPSPIKRPGPAVKDAEAGDGECDGESDGVAIAHMGSEACSLKADSARQAGNAVLTNKESTLKQIRKSLVSYNEALMWNKRRGADEDKGFAIRVLLNVALALIKLNDYALCIIHCDAVLELDPDCVKAHFRRGQACAKLFMWVRAERDLTRAADLSPESLEVKRELKLCQKHAAVFMHRSRKEFAETYGLMPTGPVYKAADSVAT